jgi:predicted P-loop ATPase
MILAAEKVITVTTHIRKSGLAAQPTSPDFAQFKECADAGHTIIPLKGKSPIDTNWTKRDYPANKALRRIERDGLNAGIRIPKNVYVLDPDFLDAKGNQGMESYNDLCLDGFDESPFHRVISGGNGKHVYGLIPPNFRTVTKLAGYAGIQGRRIGMQMVLPGSVHPDTGRLYRWEDGSPDWSTPFQLFPEFLLEIIRAPDRKTHDFVDGGQYSAEEIAHALYALDVTEFRDHDDWLQLMMACHHASGGNARSEFIDWSTSDPQFAKDAERIGSRWDSLHQERPEGQVTYRTLNKILADHGAANAQAAPDASADFEAVEDDSWLEGSQSTELVPVESRGLKLNRFSEAPDTYENALCAVVKSGLTPEWDELKQNVVFRTPELQWPAHYGRVLNDHVSRLIRMYLLNHFQGVAYSPNKDNLFEAIMTIAYAARFNPVLEYIGSLTWDGTKRIKQLFPHYFNCGDEAYTRAVSRCFMVGSVRRMRKPASKFDTMPILRSPQGWNKSTAIKELFGAQWYSDADLGNLRDKDSAMKLRGIWVQEFAEIESLTRAETGALKAFCSRATDRQRDPYGRIVEDSPRRCVFIASVNEGGYLKDSTGARRFWPLEVGAPIDVARLVADRDQLWAEAAALEAQGASDVLPADLWPVAAERQAEQTSGDPWADTLRDFINQRVADFKKYDPIEDDLSPLPPNRVHSSELFDALKIDVADQTKDKAQRLRTVMESMLGWHYRRSVRVADKVSAGYTREKLKAWLTNATTG